MKSEPDAYGYPHLEADGRTAWDGVRNYQARNYMRDEMRVGDRVFFYHSNVRPPGVVGLAEVASAPYPDPTQFDPEGRYYDPAATRDAPRWYLVDLVPLRPFPRTVTLAEMRGDPELASLLLLRRGNRLSVMPVGPGEAARIVERAEATGPCT